MKFTGFWSSLPAGGLFRPVFRFPAEFIPILIKESLFQFSTRFAVYRFKTKQ